MNIGKIEYEDLYEFSDVLKGEDYVYYGIYFDERIFGYLVFSCKENLILEDIYIKQEYRNSGYGSKLLNYAITDSMKLGYDKIEVPIHKRVDNFLEKNDFINIFGKYVRRNLQAEYNNIKTTVNVSKISIMINVLLAFFKLFIGYLFSVNSLVADGINSFSDLINNILILVGVNIGSSPNDEDHPFGHGKVEYVFSLIIGIVIIISSAQVLKEGIMHLINKNFANISSSFNLVAGITFAMIIIKLFQYMYILVKYEKYKSPLLKVLLLDYSLDILLTIAVFLGLFGTRYISPSIDSVLSIGITIYLIGQGYKSVKENTLILMDSQDENILLNVKLLTLEIPEIENIHDMYMTRVGNNIYIIADIRLNKDMTLEEAHKISEKAEKHIKFRYSNIKRVIYHIEPMYSEV